MPTLIDSYVEANAGNNFFLSSDQYTEAGQSFTAAGDLLDSAKFYFKKVGSPTGNIVAKLYAHSGTFGSTGIPTGAALATSDPIAAASIGTSDALVEFTFSGANRVALVNGTRYFITLAYSGGNFGSGDYLDVRIDTSSPTHAGNIARDLGGWGADAGTDLIFYVYSAPAITNITVEAAVQSLTANVIAAAVSGSSLFTAASQNLILSLEAPTFTNATNIVVSATVLVATFAVQAVALSTGQILSVATQSLTTTLNAASVATQAILSAATQFLTAALNAPARVGGYYQNKYASRGTTFDTKYSSRATSYNDKYTTRNH